MAGSCHGASKVWTPTSLEIHRSICAWGRVSNHDTTIREEAEMRRKPGWVLIVASVASLMVAPDDPSGPRRVDRRARMDGECVHAELRGAADDRRRARRPVRAPAAVHRRA